MSEFDEDASRFRAGKGTHARSTTAVEGPFGQDGQASPPQAVPIVAFHRRELDLILRVYGHRVASGEWRDYAIDHLKDRAVFSVFRRASEMPLYRIEKVPKNARRQGAYAVVGAGGAILKRGADLAQVLRIFDKKRHLSVV